MGQGDGWGVGRSHLQRIDGKAEECMYTSSLLQLSYGTLLVLTFSEPARLYILKDLHVCLKNAL